MSVAVALMLLLAMPQASSPQPASAPLPGPDCQRLLAAPAPGVEQLCRAESEMRATESATVAPVERERRFAAAAAGFDAASAGLREPALQIYAFEALARLFDTQHLNQPPAREQALRSLVPLMPGDSGPLRRVAQQQEEQGLVDAAEDTLLAARQQAPGDVEIYRALSHFYARRAVQISTDPSRLEAAAGPDRPAPDQPDADGYYNLVGKASKPSPLYTPAPQAPPAAAAAGVGGAVVLEVRLDEWGTVSGATILRSVPMLDAAVLAAVRNWRYTPSTIDERAVPVKMTVVVNMPPPPRPR
jgi:TonB family protein